jgi:uncharacterized membrane protein/protein-disulfide isomerase
MSRHARWIVLGLALAGLGFASASSWVHYKLLTDPTYASPCDVSATFNCSQAYLSTYGSVGGVSVALLGVGWFALVALIAAFARPSDAKSPNPAGAYVFALSTAALAAVLYLGYASAVVLRTYCLLCIGTYVAVAGIFITSGLGSTMSIARLPGRLFSDLRSVIAQPIGLVFVLLFAGGAASAMAFFPREGQQAAAPAQETQFTPEFEKEFLDAWTKQPRVDLGIPADGSKIVVVKFVDWLCPTCKMVHQAYQPIFDKYKTSDPGAIKFVTKDLPWNTGCNGYAQETLRGHEASCDAHVAVRMAADKSKGDAMVDWVFQNQAELIQLGMTGARDQASTKIKDQLRALTALTGADFDTQYGRLLPKIKQDGSDAMALQIQGTPTYFLNGVRLPMIEPSVLDLAIRIELGRGPSK